MIRVVMCRVGAEPKVEEISELGEDWQKIVGGFFDVTRVFPSGCLIANEDGRRLKLAPNRVVPGIGAILGDFFVTEFPSHDGEARAFTEKGAQITATTIAQLWPMASGKAVARG